MSSPKLETSWSRSGSSWSGSDSANTCVAEEKIPCAEGSASRRAAEEEGTGTAAVGAGGIAGAAAAADEAGGSAAGDAALPSTAVSAGPFWAVPAAAGVPAGGKISVEVSKSGAGRTFGLFAGSPAGGAAGAVTIAVAASPVLAAPASVLPAVSVLPAGAPASAVVPVLPPAGISSALSVWNPTPCQPSGPLSSSRRGLKVCVSSSGLSSALSAAPAPGIMPVVLPVASPAGRPACCPCICSTGSSSVSGIV